MMHLNLRPLDVNLNHTNLHHCYFTAPLFQWQSLVCSQFLYQRLGVAIWRFILKNWVQNVFRLVFVLIRFPKGIFNFFSLSFKTLFTWSGGPRSSGVGFFCFHALGDTKQRKPTPLDRGPPLHANRVLKFPWPVYPSTARSPLSWKVCIVANSRKIKLSAHQVVFETIRVNLIYVKLTFGKFALI